MTDDRLSDRDRTLLFGSDKLQPGDAVVHFEHGLACYDGEETVDLGDETQTLQIFVYRDGGKLMLPAVLGRDFWPYGAPAKDLVLDRLDADEWTQRRDEMIAELRDAAETLIARHKQQKGKRAPRIQAKPKTLAAAAEAFGYDETPDQARAIAAVLKDLAREVPMDRLLIGDVGFGKTEVALRAIAAAISAGYQTVFAAPTTVLARQHFETLKARFGDEAVVEVSRLLAESDRAAVLDRIASGDAKVVVGTQALLSDEITYAKVGSLIIDEEQRFGRQEKESLRALATGAHVLSMTATPIPRSLAAAEIGMLDVSVIATVPASRLPVETSLTTYATSAIEDAIAAEAARGGQSFIVCPRIETARALDTLLEERGAEFSHILAHGQLEDQELEARMLSFMTGKIEVLISTTIIESGLDNPRANTMVVIDADLFGLAQLHQLRGRIGRADTQARMLLMTDVDLTKEDENDELSAAARRLGVFAGMSEIGAGFQISREDRNIRGFGEVDGDKQSGHASHLGVGLLRHVLRQVAQEHDI